MKQQYGKRASNRGKPGEFQHKHSLGQNFLTDTALLESLVDETGVGAQDAVLEVGPGAGDMTRILAARCRHVTSVEIDRDLLPILRVAMEKYDNFSLVQGDILRVNLPEIMAEYDAFHVVANIPYYLTTELLNLLLSGRLPLRSINVMIQKEAAQRLLAAPSTPEYGPLAIRAQYYTQPRVARIVEAACFTPPPKVDSAVLSFEPLPLAQRPARPDLLALVIKVCFQQRRKQLGSIARRCPLAPWLSAAIEQAGITPTLRPEQLTVADFQHISRFGASLLDNPLKN